MSIWRYIYVFYVIIVWAVIFVFIKPQRLKALLPVSLLGVLVLFLTEEFLVTAGLYKFSNAFLPVFGIPFFHLLWGAGAAIIVMNFMPQSFIKKLFTILIFTVITMIFEYFPENYANKATHVGKYSEIHDAIQDFLSLLILVTFSEGFFGKRIKRFRSNS